MDMNYPIVEVVWHDHRDVSDTDWKTLKQTLEQLSKEVEIHSFGYLVEETTEHVVVATTMDVLSKKLDTAYAIKILKGTIIRRRELSD